MKQINEILAEETKKSFIKPKKTDNECEFGGILNYNHGVGFKVIFIGSDKTKNAQHYKDMFKWIIGSDNLKVKSKNGYHDRKE